MRRIFVASLLVIAIPCQSDVQAVPHIEIVETKLPLNCGKNKLLSWKTSWYGEDFHGRPMANAKIFDMHNPGLAAHKTLRFGTELLVTNPENCRTVQVVIKDRGPYFEERELDLSFAAAQELDFVEKGVGTMYIKIIN